LNCKNVNEVASSPIIKRSGAHNCAGIVAIVREVYPLQAVYLDDHMCESSILAKRTPSHRDILSAMSGVIPLQ
jgi:hypothetical protein